MDLPHILVFAAAALVVRLLASRVERGWLLLGISALAVYALQPATPIRWLDYWLPTATLALTTLSWALTMPPGKTDWRLNLPAAGVLAGAALAVSLLRYTGLDGVFTPTPPPPVALALAGLAAAAAFIAAAALLARRRPGACLWGLFALLVALFIALKTPAISVAASGLLRSLTGQSTALAAAADLRWLGYSYVAFRLIHTLRDRQSGRLPAVGLRDYALYVLFFPAFTAGPIDRLERFLKDLQSPLEDAASGLGGAGQRLLVGLFKKFVVADALAVTALSPLNAGQVQTVGWAWPLLLAYSLQIYFDFSGYTDIAIGIGRLAGIRLPENFNHPYLKPNLAQFWNNWHMTLTQWVRGYFFNPVTRALRSARQPIPAWAALLLTQMGTMLLIGLWHGVTLNFAAWGAWHGLGLFVQNRWGEWARPRLWARLPVDSPLRRGLTALGIALTFLYVTLGWVWFALPAPAGALAFFRLLAGG